MNLVQQKGNQLSLSTINYCKSIIEQDFNSVMDLFSQNSTGYKSRNDMQPLLR